MHGARLLDDRTLRRALIDRLGPGRCRGWLESLEFRALSDVAGIAVEISSQFPEMLDLARGRYFGEIAAEIRHLIVDLVEISFEDAA